MALAEGPGAILWFTLPAGKSLPSGNDTALISTVTDESGAVVSEHMVQLVTPQQIQVPVAKVTAKVCENTSSTFLNRLLHFRWYTQVSEKSNADGTINITVSADKVALWVTLTSMAQGHFSDNTFFLPGTTKLVQFIPFSPLTAMEDLGVLQRSLRVEDLSMYRALPLPPTTYIEAPSGSTCQAAKLMQLDQAECQLACAHFGGKYTGARSRPSMQQCFMLTSGQWKGNCNYNTNASAVPGPVLGNDARSLCMKQE